MIKLNAVCNNSWHLMYANILSTVLSLLFFSRSFTHFNFTMLFFLFFSLESYVSSISFMFVTIGCTFDSLPASHLFDIRAYLYLFILQSCIWFFPFCRTFGSHFPLDSLVQRAIRNKYHNMKTVIYISLLVCHDFKHEMICTHKTFVCSRNVIWWQ